MIDKKVQRKGNTEQVKAGSQFEETKRADRYSNRNREAVVEQGPERVRRARQSGPHAKSVSADGSKFVAPLKKKKTSGGDGDSK